MWKTQQQFPLSRNDDLDTQYNPHTLMWVVHVGIIFFFQTEQHSQTVSPYNINGILLGWAVTTASLVYE